MSGNIFFVCFIFLMVACISFVLFGQITVRKLRKNPETRESLGVSLLSGWDIINVSTVLSLPKNLTKKMEGSRFAALEANRSSIEDYVNFFDKLLARIFFFSWNISVILVLILVIFDS